MKTHRPTKTDVIIFLILLYVIGGFTVFGKIRMINDPQKPDIVYKLKDVNDGCVSFKYSTTDDDQQYEVGDMFLEGEWAPLGEQQIVHKYLVISKKETK